MAKIKFGGSDRLSTGYYPFGDYCASMFWA